MRTFIIDQENNITVFASEKQARSSDSPGSETFLSQKELATLAADWPIRRLVEIWNSLTGIDPVKKFTDRKTAIARIWKAIQSLQPASLEAPETVAPLHDVGTRRAAKSKPTGKAKMGRKAAPEGNGPREGSKHAKILELIRKPKGSTLQDLMTATGWQAHSVRGFLSAVVGKRLGLKLESSKDDDGQRVYRKPPSQSGRTFLKNHAQQLVSVDFFVVPTLNLRLLFVFVILDHDRRRLVHFNVTDHPTAEWTAQQMIEAFPWDKTPRFLIRDRDRCYGNIFRQTVQGMNIQEVLTAPHSPWQNGYVERLIGSIRRECLDHVIVLNKASLRRTLRSYFLYYERARTHLALGKDAPEPRTVQLPQCGEVVELPEVGGLHHRYERRAA